MVEVPKKFSITSPTQTTDYVLVEDCFVLSSVEAEKRHARVLFQLEDDNLAVCRTMDATQPPDGNPVYRIGSRGSLAIPTGKIFLRFAEGTKLENQKAALERAGFNLVQTLSYAPHAGWVEPKSGRIAHAIVGFENLKRLPGVEAAEPQMLMESQRR